MNDTTLASVATDKMKNNNTGWMAGVDLPAFLISGGALTLFVIFAFYDIDVVSSWVASANSVATTLFGAYWQILLLLTFIIGLALGLGRTGSVVMGGLDKPESSTFKWVAVIMCTLLAGGGVFWAAAEPMAHFASTPPIFAGTPGAEAGTLASAYNALSQSFMHWGFLAWAIQGSLTGIVMMYLHYEKGLPLKPRTLLYPVFGERIIHGRMGSVVDACCVLAVVAGTVGPIGFLGLQVGYGLEKLFNIPNTFTTQALIVVGLICLYTFSAVRGVNKGIQLLSTANVLLAVVLMLFLLIFGPTQFIFDGFIHSFGAYVNNFIPMATFRADTVWLDSWTVFFWGWFLGYGPLMAMFIARISRGRTIRQMILMVSVIAPIITCFWFTILGGSGLAFELQSPGVISEPFTGFNLPAVLMAITEQLPLGMVISILFLVLTTIFVATSGDSMTYSISMVMTGHDSPHKGMRVFWGVMMGVVAILLISIGSGGISALQSFIVVTAAPVSLVLLPSIWSGPQIARKMMKEQGL